MRAPPGHGRRKVKSRARGRRAHPTGKQLEQEGKPDNPNGRPTSLAPAVMSELEQNLRLGMNRTDSAILAGIHRSTFYHWLERAKAAREAKRTSAFTRFLDVIEKAEATAVRQSLVAVRVGRQGWQAHAWFLERKRVDEWGRPWRLEKRDPNDPAAQVQVVRLPVRTASAEEWTQQFMPTQELEEEPNGIE